MRCKNGNYYLGVDSSMPQKKPEMLDAKALHIYTKKGWTEKDFCKNYGLTPKKFWNKVDSMISEKGARVIRKNIKRNEHLQTGSQANKTAKGEVTVRPEKHTVDDVDEGLQLPEETTGADEESCVSKMPNEREAKRLAKKEKQIQKKQAQMQALIKRQNALNSRKEEIQQNELTQLREQLMESYQRIRQLLKKTGSLKKELRELIDEKQELEDTIKATTVMLDELKQESNELRPLSILCYKSGEIDIISASDETDPLNVSADWINIATHNPDECSPLTSGQIRGVANILEMVKTARFWQVEFENVQAKKLFEKLIEEEAA